MASTFAKALNATHSYLHKMGAKVAPDRSYNFASTNKVRQWLRDTHWELINSGIEVISDFRYLGAHLTTRENTNSSTLDKRWERAKQQLKRLRHCPATTEAKARIILAKIYAGAMYGIEAAGVTPKKIASLAAAVIDVFKSRNNNHNANQFFSTITKSKNDLDPVAQIFARRVTQVRRTACKKKHALAKFQNILGTYANTHKKGNQWPEWYMDNTCDPNGMSVSYPNEQPHPSSNEYDVDWNKEVDPVGPIGLLIESVVWHGMKIDDDLKIWQKNEEPLDVMAIPYQDLQPLILKAAGRARNRGEWTRGTSSKRSRMPLEIDNDVSRVASNLDDEAKGIIRTIQMGGNLAPQRNCRLQPRRQSDMQLLRRSTSDQRPHSMGMQTFRPHQERH